LTQKITAITTNNESNMVTVCNNLKLNPNNNSVEFSHYHCICHIINIAVGNELKKVKTLIKKV